MSSAVRRHAPLPGSCAGMWTDADEPAWGSAAPATFWVALEQPGPWGHKALTESRLAPEIGRALERGCAAAGGRALLIRSTGEHHVGRGECPSHRRLYVAGGMPEGTPWLLTGEIGDPSLVLDLPFATLGGADPGPALEAVRALSLTQESVLLVCTNARRDACCAVLGRPLALEAGTLRPGRVWECTHTGGHRFSPTGVVLPTGATLARLTPDLAVRALEAADRQEIGDELLRPRHHRGLSHLAPPLQAADAWVRHWFGEGDVRALTVRRLSEDEEPDGSVRVRVDHSDGRSLEVVATKSYDEARPRKNSCTTGPVPAESWRVAPVPAAGLTGAP